VTPFESFRPAEPWLPLNLRNASAPLTPPQRANDTGKRDRGGAAVLAKRGGVGRAKSFTSVPALVDTNVLVYRFDPRFPEKQSRATALLRAGIADGSIRVPHQAIVEFVAAVTRPLGAAGPLLSPAEARREAEEFLHQFDVLYPDEAVVRTALRGAAAYGLSWFDAHLWAYAEVFGLDPIFSEDFEHDRRYGTVRVANPFLARRGS